LIEARRVKKTRHANQEKNIIGPRVKAARRRCKPRVSQQDLSGRLARLKVSITQTSLSKIENRQRYVMDYEAAAIAKALRVTVAWLYGETP
jgi:hypothetical protein